MCDRICPEFDCCECGRHIILVSGELREPPLCAACISLPGWFRDPKIRDIIDPEHDGRGRDEPKVLQ